MEQGARIVKILGILKRQQNKDTMLGSMGKRYDAFKILISTILSARSRDEVTYPICEELFLRYPDVDSLAKADPKDVEKIIRRIGFYKNKTKNIIRAAEILLADFGGKVPDSMDDLLKLPGVGRKVAGCVLVYAFKKDAIPADTHVHRVSNRTGLVKTGMPEKTEIELMKITPRRYWQLVNDLFVFHGKNVCKPITPLCFQCKIIKYCKYKKKNI